MTNITHEFHAKITGTDFDGGHLVAAQQGISKILALVLLDVPIIQDNGEYWFELRRYLPDGCCFLRERYRKEDIADLRFLPTVGNMFEFFEIAE